MRNNSGVKKFSVALTDSILVIFIITIESTKQIKNEMEQKKRCKICHINAQNAAHFILYLAFCFERLKHVQNFSLKVSRTQELSCI